MKKRGKHLSYDKSLRRPIEWLEKLDGVTKVILGRSEGCRHHFAPGYVRVQAENKAGIRIKAFTDNGVMSIFVVIQPIEKKEAIKAQITERFA